MKRHRSSFLLMSRKIYVRKNVFLTVLVSQFTGRNAPVGSTSQGASSPFSFSTLSIYLSPVKQIVQSEHHVKT